MIKPLTLTLSGRRRRQILKQSAPGFLTHEVAKIAGVSWRTLNRWVGAGRLPDPPRDPNGYRRWPAETVALAKQFGVQAAKYRRNTNGNAKNRRAELEGRNGQDDDGDQPGPCVGASRSAGAAAGC